jgi:hypothetical protein
MHSTPTADLMPKHFGSTCLVALLLVVVLCGAALNVTAQARPDPAPEQESPEASSPQPLTLTEQIIRDVLEPLQRGIEEHRPAQVLAVLDPQETPDYAQLRDQIRAFFSQYESIRFRYKVLQVTSEKDRGSAIAEVDTAATPADETRMAVQRSAQMSFQLKLGAKGWKLVGFEPGDFFAQ